MCCTTMMIHEAAMTTTELARTACYEVCWPEREPRTAQQGLVRMSWVVVTDENGTRQLRMRWGT